MTISSSAHSESTPPERIDLGDLLLRRWRHSDLTRQFDAVSASHTHLRPWMSWAEQPPTLAGQRRFLQTSAAHWPTPDGGYLYGIFTARGEVAGGIGLEDRIDSGALEIGYWCHVAHTGRGIITRAAHALTAAALTLPHVVRTEIHCDAANVRSAAVPRRLGYELVSTAPRPRTAPADSGIGMVWATTARAAGAAYGGRDGCLSADDPPTRL
ncbi:GNAT family N-acetyltransferase [Nocardia fluminea]|uniref:RimJ/RimL family protein N-acetyltransferase n=1 Tax=Nocardia fluminea TaxID=134984 RepID=A0A2N3VI78_9NOCA|nr:GNAT family N-acetyltransferase [Nocardia fluminea]PKV81338.1 RimJ/RimL family protein N-acetyltransferase [Nocardia fluminea]